MNIDIRELFADILPDPAKEMEDRALTRSALMSKGMQGPLAGLAATVGYNSSRGAEGMRRGLNKMLGGGLSTGTERLNQAAQNIDASTPEGQTELLSIVRRERGAGAAEQLREFFRQRNLEDQKLRMDQQQMTLREREAETSARSTNAYARSVDASIEQQQAARERQERLDALARNQISGIQSVMVDGKDSTIALRGGQDLVMQDGNGNWVPVTGQISLPNGRSLSATAAKKVIELSEKSTQASSNSARAGTLAGMFQQLQPSAAEIFKEGFAERLGISDVELRQMLSEYQTLAIQAMKANQSSGPQSDKDIALAMKPIPRAADWETMVSWLNGFKKLQMLEAERTMRLAEVIESGDSQTEFAREWQNFVSSEEAIRQFFGSEYSEQPQRPAAPLDRNAAAEQALQAIQTPSPLSMNRPPFRGF